MKSTEERLAVIENDITHMSHAVTSINTKLDTAFVQRIEFNGLEKRVTDIENSKKEMFTRWTAIVSSIVAILGLLIQIL